MTAAQRVLDHQSHRLALATDGGAGPAQYSLLWRHPLWAVLPAQLVSATVVSTALIHWANRECVRHLARGRYVEQTMASAQHGRRLASDVVRSRDAWDRRPAVMLAGLAIVLRGCRRGRLVRALVQYD